MLARAGGALVAWLWLDVNRGACSDDASAYPRPGVAAPGLEVPFGACERHTGAKVSASALILLEDDRSSTVAFFANFKLFLCLELRQAGSGQLFLRRQVVKVSILAAVLSGFTFIAVPALAQTDADMDKRLDETMGSHKDYAKFFSKLQKAVAADDKQALSAMVYYPFAVHSKGKAVMIKDAKHFVAAYDQIITPKVKAAVVKQTYATLFANWQGVMIGDGDVWFQGIGDKLEVKIFAVNN
ncbi:hypothetical protein [Phyllobacterium calauticae]|uniref:hypothetical protein n=1 Tax=Phyllobacterium calauticae TaxID=2817027 RepID=UPI001CBABAB8|nr:hypothetical protein [Phyllobacterium calauticae]